MSFILIIFINHRNFALYGEMDRTDVVRTLSRWFKGKRQAPVNVELHPTYLCNSKCVFCEQRRGEYVLGKAMPKEKWLSIIDELHKLGTKKIQISGGGEPSMVPVTTMAMMILAKKYGMECKVNTNGTRWKEEDIRTMVDIGLDKIIFSIDSFRAWTHDGLRGKRGVFKEAVKNIKLLNKIKKEQKKKTPVIEFNSVITNKNYKDVVGLVKMCSKLGVESITAEPVFITVDFVHKLKLNQRQSLGFKEILKKANKAAKNNSIQTNFENLIKLEKFDKSGDMGEVINKKENSYTLCFEPWYFPKIGPNGEFGPCCNYPYARSGMNINGKKFAEIWFGEQMDKFRKSLLNKEMNEICRNCTFSRVAINKELEAQLKAFKNQQNGKRED